MRFHSIKVIRMYCYSLSAALLIGRRFFFNSLSFVFFLTFLHLVSYYSPVYGETHHFDDVHQRYLSLRNTDLEFRRSKEWGEVADAFIEASWEEDDPLRAQRSLYEAAILLKTLSKHQDSNWNLLRALSLLEELVGRFATGALADDGLLMQSEILEDIGMHDQAQGTLQQIVTSYAAADMVYVARRRLQGRESPQDKPISVQVATHSQLPVIVLDPGHGGEDFGAFGVGGLLEKDVALSITLQVKKLLEQVGKYRVVLTRNSDKFSPLAERMQLANRLKAVMFVSIHANASVGKKLSGIETYYLDNASDKASATLAERENKAGAGQGDLGEDLSFMLSDLIQNAKLPESITLAKSIQRAVVHQINTHNYSVADLGVKSGPFYVLVGAHMPCALVEVSFIDHLVEGARLGTDGYREQIAIGIVEGIKRLEGPVKVR